MPEATWNCGDIGKPLCSACNLPVVDLTQHPGCGAPMTNLSEPKPAMTEAMDEHIIVKGLQMSHDGAVRDAGYALDAHIEELRTALAASEARQAEQAATIARLREAVLTAAVAFEVYADNHTAKANLGPANERSDRQEKAERNAELASAMRTALEDQHG